jgi:hypothetical protein
VTARVEVKVLRKSEEFFNGQSNRSRVHKTVNVDASFFKAGLPERWIA